MLFYKVMLAVLLTLVASDSASNRVGLQGDVPASHGTFIKSQSGSEDRKYFHIFSHLNGLVMDILNRDRRPGAHIIMWSKKEMSRSNQLWYQESNGMIRSQMNGLCMDVGSDGYATTNYCHEEAPMQKWVFNGKKIQNSRNGSLILDVSFYNRNLGARVAIWTYNGGLNQHWYRQEVSEEV